VRCGLNLKVVRVTPKEHSSHSRAGIHHILGVFITRHHSSSFVITRHHSSLLVITRHHGTPGIHHLSSPGIHHDIHHDITLSK
jgi:hypothetical protein